MPLATQPVSPIAPISDAIRDEIIALLADPPDADNDVRLGMDLIEIAQERLEDDDEDADLVRISSSVPV